jgi:hypothetical protein
MKPVVTVLKAAVLLLVFALLAAGSGWAQSDQQQSLGDIARKQREKKGQAEPKGTKVLTNEDLPHSGGLASSGSSSGTAASPASATGQATDAAAAPEAEKQAAAPGEASGMTAAEEADAAKKKLEGLKHDEASYKNGISHFEELLSNEVNESRRELYRNAMQHGQERLAENLKQQAETEKEVAAKEAAAKQQQQNQPPPAQPQPEQPPQPPQ